MKIGILGMRYVRTVLTPPGGGLTELGRAIAGESSVTRERIHNANLLEDGTVVALLEMSGDADVVREIADDLPDVLDYEISEGYDQLTVYTEVVATETIRSLLSLFDEHELLLDMPIEYTSDGNLRVSVIGEKARIKEVSGALPDSLAVHLEELGDHDIEDDRLYSTLTSRQRETLQAALELGYYQVPREATHSDIAAELDRSDGTVGEHLRKIETKVMERIGSGRDH